MLTQPTTKEEKLRHCRGCHDDYYNHNHPGECWMLANMEVVLRKEVSVDQRPPWNQKAQPLPKCYHRPRYVYVKPDQTQ